MSHHALVYLGGGIVFMLIPRMPGGPWMVDLRPVRRRLAAGEPVKRTDLIILRINQAASVAFVVGGACLALYGAWLAVRG